MTSAMPSLNLYCLPFISCYFCPGITANGTLESMRVTKRDEIVGERGIARATHQNIRDASFSISSHCYRHRQRPRISASKVLHPRLERHCITRPPEAIAFADQIADRDAFNAPTDGEGKAASVRDRPSYADTSQVLIRHRHDRFRWTGSSRQDSVRVARVEQVRSGCIDRGLLDPLVRLHVQRNAPAAITQLDRLINDGRYPRAIGQRRYIR